MSMTDFMTQIATSHTKQMKAANSLPALRQNDLVLTQSDNSSITVVLCLVKAIQTTSCRKGDFMRIPSSSNRGQVDYCSSIEF